MFFFIFEVLNLYFLICFSASQFLPVVTETLQRQRAYNFTEVPTTVPKGLFSIFTMKTTLRLFHTDSLCCTNEATTHVTVVVS